MVCLNCGAPTSAENRACQRCASSISTVVGVVTPPVASEDVDLTRPGPPSSGMAAADGSTLQPGQKFTPRYTILKLLGAGGMGEVYQAWDEVLGASVALKIIRPQLVASPFESQQFEERFRRELRLARQVTHPNVVRIHDLGELGDTRYLTMEFVPGADLGKTSRRDGKIAVPRALAIAKQIAAGLAAVHAAGVVHRDLKPANIIIDEEDRAHLTDFGIARALDASTIQTIPGSVVGTLQYMAPEQARGEPADHRSDIYAFGMIVYEMLAGGRPRTRSDSALASLIERLEKGPAPLSSVVPDIPLDVERLVTRCLAPDRDKRYPSIAAVIADLDALDPDGRARLVPRTAPLSARGTWLAIATALAVGLVTAAVMWFGFGQRPAPPVAAHEPLSILIADFINAAQDPVFDRSLEQALGVAMEASPFITSYARRPGTRLDEAGARLLSVREGIAVVLAGTIARAESGFELSVKVINPATGEVSTTATARAANKAEVLQAVGKVAESVRTSLGGTSLPNEFKAETFTAATLDAMKSYSTAQALSNDGRNAEAIRYYREAVKHDPTFGRAYAGWAIAAVDSGRREEGQEMWAKALKLVDGMTERERYRTLGNYFLQVANNPDKAIENYEKLVSLYPADLAGHNNLAVAYFSNLRLADALRQGRRAIDLYPKSLKFRGNYALYAMYASDFKSAADAARAIVKEAPTYLPAYLPIAIEALAAGDVPGAIRIYTDAAAISPDGASFSAIGLADIALFQGRYLDAAAILEPAIAADRSQKNSAGAAAKTIALAEAHSALGRTAQAFKDVDQALALSHDDAVVVPAARVLIRGGADDRAQALIKELSRRLSAQSRAYARLLETERAVARGQAGEAMDALAASKKLADLWFGRFVAGVAYETFGHHVEARDEFQKCAQRLGEASAMFLDDIPTFRYTAALREWTARVSTAAGPAPPPR
jgi:eukaryotic-like serine/threonine-protein kinase